MVCFPHFCQALVVPLPSMFPSRIWFCFLCCRNHINISCGGLQEAVQAHMSKRSRSPFPGSSTVSSWSFCVARWGRKWALKRGRRLWWLVFLGAGVWTSDWSRHCLKNKDMVGWLWWLLEDCSYQDKSYSTCTGSLLSEYVQGVLSFCCLILVTQSRLCYQDSCLGLLTKAIWAGRDLQYVSCWRTVARREGFVPALLLGKKIKK